METCHPVQWTDRSWGEFVNDTLLTFCSFFHDICTVLKEANVKIYSGPRLASSLTFGPPPAASLKTEYGDLACTIEVTSHHLRWI